MMNQSGLNSIDHPINLYLISGFLGAGKTTFLKNLLENTQGKKIGVIINEFSSIGIDGKVLQREDLTLVEINNGSIFCSCMKSGFVRTLIAFLDQPIDQLFIEASGMADPSSMESLLEQVSDLTQKKSNHLRNYKYRGSVCIVDCTTFLKYSDLLPAAQNQVIKSNLILINKTDLAKPEEIEGVHGRINELNPAAHLVDTCFSRVPFETLERYWIVGNESAPSSNHPWNRPATVILDMQDTYDRAKIVTFCKALSDKALRIKGFFRDQHGAVHIDGIGNQIDLEDGQEVERMIPPNPKIVIIGKQEVSFEGQLRSLWSLFLPQEIHISDE
jgi:G3E family GTPase